MPVKNAINGIDFKENLLAIITVILNVKRILNSGEHLEGLYSGIMGEYFTWYNLPAHLVAWHAACNYWSSGFECSISFSVPPKFIVVDINCSNLTLCVIVHLKQEYIPFCFWNILGGSALLTQNQNCKERF